jgi:mRNA interferase RelE/StbE
MEQLNILFTKSSIKEYKKLPLGYKKLIDNVLDKLSKNELIDIKPIQGEIDIFRIRVGKYRILIKKILPDVLVIKIDVRGDIYK